ncbi:unnamed protein product [Cylicostephanus goldi]|uniref:Uncharacterized protein n=1 Tax=Cylicostephanus goldi TaxID=71465 RepID=A0A3P7QMT7_CYLGO|nr:unnamed protein product [Cylicostephanus goldi]
MEVFILVLFAALLARRFFGAALPRIANILAGATSTAT